MQFDPDVDVIWAFLGKFNLRFQFSTQNSCYLLNTYYRCQLSKYFPKVSLIIEIMVKYLII